jgi:stage II sporulation protein D
VKKQNEISGEMDCKKGGKRMRKGMGLALLLLAEGFLMPLMAVGVIREGAAETAPVEETPTQESQAAEPTGWDSSQTLRVQTEEGIETMTLSDYLWGVVAAEMPASFEEEALKAQAVAARSETLYRQANPNANHPEADICTDHTCCQAYITPQAAEEKWGADSTAYGERVTQAVSGTDGVVVTYEGAIIQAVFHSSSDGHTLAASQVWGGDLPYLQAVDSPEGDEVPNYYSVVTVSASEFRETILGEAPSAALDGTPNSWSVTENRDGEGTLESVTIGGETVAATRMRTLFSLRSARFSLELGEDSVTFYVTGYGHGVGMSQYGANALAKEGLGYEEILTWYYTGVEVQTAENL